MLSKTPIKFEVTTQLVVVNVAVKAKNGEPIDNLKASDFSVTEDGKPQQIKVFEFQSLQTDPLPAVADTEEPAGPATQTVAVAKVKPSVSTAIASGKQGEIKYKDRRLLVLFFDQAGMAVSEQVRARDAALKFIQKQISPSDLVAVMTFATDLNVVQDFTGDRAQLVKVVKGLAIGETGLSTSTSDDSAVDTGAAYSQDDSEFTIFNTDRKLAALESAVKALGKLSEKKALVYISSGMQLTGTDNQAQLRATVNAAIRSNVAFYPIDAKGLTAAAPLGDATQGSQGGQGMFSGSSQRAAQSNDQQRQETLYTLASDTGGKVFLDQNDLSLGIVQAQKDVASYYILGYYSTFTELDGRYHRIKVALNNRNLTARLDYRTGYFASKEFRQFTSSDRERQLQEALMLGDPMTDLTLALEVNYFRQAKDRYFVPVSVKILGSDIATAKKGGAESTRLDFIGEVRDAKSVLAGTVRDEITVKLKGDNAGMLEKQNLSYDTGFSLAPGTYTLKFLARENATGKIGTFETKFTVPDLTGEYRRLPTSSVVLGYQREKLSQALATAERDKKLIAANPLVRDGEKLVPSVTRVFRKDHQMYVYLEAYQPGADKTQLMVANVSFFRGRVKAFETAPLKVDDGLNAKSKAVPVSFAVPLDKLEPGRYTCQVTVLDPSAQKFSVWRSPMVLLPAASPEARN